MSSHHTSFEKNTGFHTFFEYRLVLHPHEELWSRIVKLKHEFAEKFDSASARFGKPQLGLVNFFQLPEWEHRILNRLHLIALAQAPFIIELQNFGAYPTQTLFFQVKNKATVQQLVKQIRTEASRLFKHDDQHKPLFLMDPHITLANRLKPWQFEKGWLEFSQRQFTGRFMARDMLLLRRKPGESGFQVVEQFHFQNLPVGTKQGLLFSKADGG